MSSPAEGRRPVRVYTTAVADLMHAGHVRLFERCRAFGDVLVVGVHSDAVVKSYKRAPVFSEEDRYFLVGSCQFVDEVLRDAPLVITKELLDENSFDVVVTATADGNQIVDSYHQAAADCGKLRFLPRTAGLSTTDFITKVVKEYQHEVVGSLCATTLDDDSLAQVRAARKALTDATAALDTLETRLGETATGRGAVVEGKGTEKGTGAS